jgi:hypothetical protein
VAPITVTISPIWFDCSAPGIFIALFLWSLGPNHIPLPLHAFDFPLLRHAPSVNTLTVWCLRFAPGSILRFAGCLEGTLGFVKIRKHLVRSFLVVIEGSKVINSFWYHACRFFLFLDVVSERSPCLSSRMRGLYLGKSAFILF